MLIDFVHMGLKHPYLPPPLNIVDYVFTIPIMAYIMKGGENMNGGLSKSFF